MGRYGKVGPSGMKGYSKHRAALLPCFSGNCFPSKFTVVFLKFYFISQVLKVKWETQVHRAQMESQVK